MITLRQGICAALLLVLVQAAGPVFAQRPGERGQPGIEARYSEQRFLYTNDVGDVHAKKTSNAGPLHFFGDLGIGNADYTRGAYSGNPDSTSLLSFPVDLSAVFEIAKGRKGSFDQMAFTAGFTNSVANDRPLGLAPGVNNVPRWYKSDPYVAFAAHLAGEWIGALTYTMSTSPDTLLTPTTHHATLTARDVAGISPQVKLIEPTDGAPGNFVAASVRPTFDFGQKKGLKLHVPIAVGVGNDDFYGSATGTASYGSVGFTFTWPFGDPAFGVWALSAGADAIYRDDTLAATGGPFADHHNFVWDASVMVHFYY